MDRKIFVKTALTALLAFFAAGGACYELPQEVSSEKMVAADVFTFYRIEEYTSDDGKCKRRITTRFSGDNKTYLLKPPARATYNGERVGDDNGGNSGEFGCPTDRAEFVLTDRQGGEKIDVYELKKAKLVSPAQIDRMRDLRIPIELDKACVYDFSGTIAKDEPDDRIFFRFFSIADEADLAERLKNYDARTNQAFFLRGENLLVIPKTILATLPAGDLTLSIGVEQKLFKPKPSAVSSSLESEALSYVYSLEAKLKSK